MRRVDRRRRRAPTTRGCRDAVAALVSRIGSTGPITAVSHRCCRPRLPKPPTAVPELARAVGDHRRGAGARAEPAVRLQQLCGAVTAKAVGGLPLLPRCPAGVAERGGRRTRAVRRRRSRVSPRSAAAGTVWPPAMTTLSTHDTKRGEDVRARIGVLSQVPALWAEFVAAGTTGTPAPDPATGLFLWQNIFGVWPADGVVTDELRARLHAYAEKAIREAACAHVVERSGRTSSRTRCTAGWTPSSTARSPRADRAGRRLDPHARNDALAQKLCAADRPGHPGHLPGHRAVGRQPRRSRQPPPGRLLVSAGSAGHAGASPRSGSPPRRCGCVAIDPALFLPAGTRRCWPAARRATHRGVTRGDDVLVAVTPVDGSPGDPAGADGWGDTVLPLPDRHWTDVLTGGSSRAASRPPNCCEPAGRAAGAAHRCLSSRCGHRSADACGLTSRAVVPDDDAPTTAGGARPSTRRRTPATGSSSTTTRQLLPDPRSARQPDGVHERSQLWDPPPATWTDRDWPGRTIAGAR